jgi:glutamate-1-semialdehyde 2,1-aminomutase
MTSSHTPAAAQLACPQLWKSPSEREREIFQQEFHDFVPADAFDIHAHFYDVAHIAQAHGWPLDAFYSQGRVGWDAFQTRQQSWMGKHAPQAGLFFGFPIRQMDINAANAFVRDEIQAHPDSRGLLLIKPESDPAEVEARVASEGWAGFKVYHVFASRPDTQNACIPEYLPEWAWEIANRHGLAIMLHQVRQRSLADEENQKTINAMCRKYPNAKLILAHAARGFCAQHTVEGIGAIAGLENVYFDTSAVCESPALEAILKTFGPTRLLYGSDFMVSEGRGKAVTLGDGFHWIYDWQEMALPMSELILIGLESLRAVKQACLATNCDASDIQQIFSDNARGLLRLERSVEIDEQALYREAKTLIPGGVQLLSKRPEMHAPEVWPPYYREARGCEVITKDGRHLLDFTTNGIGSCLLGYAHPEVTEVVLRRVRLGAMSSLNSPEEVELAQRLIELHPWADNVRFGRMGGEAMAMAVRMARAATGRDKIAFCGYHGWHDWYLAANLQSGQALNGHLLPGLQPSGVPRALGGSAIPFNYNDLDGLKEIVREHGNDLAAIVMEPLRSYLPEEGFLEGVRALCDESGARLVLDEVTAGFRFHRGGAHMQFGVTPDLAVFAKTLGNGHPMAAVVGRGETMQAAQESFISSTYWTESVGPVAALATLDVMQQVDVVAHVTGIGEQVRSGLQRLAVETGAPLQVGGFAPLMKLHFEHAQGGELMTLFTARMLEHGFLAGGGFYPTLAHTEQEVTCYLDAARIVLSELSDVIRQDKIVETLKTPVKHGGFARLN